MKTLLPFQGKVLRIHLGSGRITREDLPDSYRAYLGGRGINSKRILDEVPAEADPLGPENKLIFGTGLLSGTSLPGQRLTITAKSPQTNILGDGNAGGFWGTELKYAGFDQLILEDKSDNLVYIYINNDAIKIVDAGHLRGKDTKETQVILRKEVGDSYAQIACVGPAAENGVTYSGIFTNMVRPCARTGMGRVMAAKNVKAIVVRGTNAVGVVKKREFDKIISTINARICNHPEYPSRRRMGTTLLISVLNSMGMLNTKNSQTGVFPDADLVSGETLALKYNIKQRGCFACTMPCSRYYKIPTGTFAGLEGEGPEFEGLASFTSRILNKDLCLALKAVDMCNRYGMDVIAVSATIAYCMECYEKGLLRSNDLDGLEMNWGNGPNVLKLIEKISKREGIGDVLGDGVKKAAERIGGGSEKYAMQSKGLELFLGEPRGIKAYGLGCAVASRGGDHTRSEPFFELLENPELGRERFGVPEAAMRLEWKGKGKVVKYFEEWSAISDSLNMCRNTMVCMETADFLTSSELVSAATGIGYTESGMKEIGERIINTERIFNVTAGIRRVDDCLPDRFLKEPLPAECGPSAGSVFEQEPMLDEYYQERGWEIKSGLPKKQVLRRLGLADKISLMEDKGILLMD